MGLDFLAFASNFARFSGPNNPILDLGNYLHDQGRLRFAIVTHKAIPDPEFVELTRFPVAREMLGSRSVEMARLVAGPANVAIARRAVRRHQPQAMIVLSGIDTAFEVSLAARKSIPLGHNVLFNVAHRRWAHEVGPGVAPVSLQQEVVFGALDRIAVRTIVRRIMAHTDFQRRMYMALGVPRERIVVVPHCIDAKRIRRAAEVAPTHDDAGRFFSLLYVGRLEPEKGILELLEAAFLASAEVPLQLRIVGIGSLRPSVESAAKSAPSGGALLITYVPQLPSHELAGAFRGADAVIIPSYLEPFGMVALESMAVGTPIVGVKQGGLSEIVRDGVEGMMVESPSPPLLARAIVSLAADRRLRRHLGSHGEQRVAEKYDVGVVAPQFVRFIESAD